MSETNTAILEEFHRILTAAVECGASDVHIKSGAPVRFRLNTEIIDVDCPQPTAEWLKALTAVIASQLAQKRLADEGEADFAYEAPGVGRYRVNLFTQRGRLALALRLVKGNIPSISLLNLPDVVRQLAETSHGLILVSGATGSGKSTTLAAMLEYINEHFKKHIITLEDPIEYIFQDKQSVIEQREIGIDTQSFGAGLKHVLRQDPDIIMIGEMRDAESFAAAMRAVNTGHLVISTVHSTRATQTLTRVLEFFEPVEHDHVRRQLAAGLVGVICQELLQDAEGKLRPALEIMLNNEMMRNLIEAGKLEALITTMEKSASAGMRTFNQSLLELLQEGLITQEIALRHSPQPEALRMNFKGIFHNA
ncbi:MAG: PilT/PilU family type 4a pilus ATPase [Chthoniobacteraceae bacterium]